MPGYKYVESEVSKIKCRTLIFCESVNNKVYYQKQDFLYMSHGTFDWSVNGGFDNLNKKYCDILTKI